MFPDEPIPQEAGALVPPPRHPPTAVAAATPEPDPIRRRTSRARSRGVPGFVRMLGRTATLVLDVLDDVGDAVARRIGLRSAAGKH